MTRGDDAMDILTKVGDDNQDDKKDDGERDKGRETKGEKERNDEGQ